jgi:ATP-dependent Clp protease ATP-binding subunit ClpX
MSPTLKHYCSFCLKSQDEVAKLCGGVAVAICDGCVAVCEAYMEGRTPPGIDLTPPDRIPTDRLLAQLPAIELTVRGKQNQLQWVVDQLRAREVSWAVIGEKLGVSRQAAWERFS